MFRDPEALVIVAVALILAALVTWIASLLVGRRMAKRNLAVAGIVTALAAPAIALACGIVLFRIDSAAHPGSDGPVLGLAGTIAISQLMLLATIPTAWLSLRRSKAADGGDTPRAVSNDAGEERHATALLPTIRMTRDSVCMADDVDAPHEEIFPVAAADTLGDVAATVAASGYLPMPSDAWGWTIEAGEVVVAIRPGLVRRRVVVLQGDPKAVMARDHPELTALYVRPGSRWRDVAAIPSTRNGRRGAVASRLRMAALPCALLGIVAFTTACQPGSVGPLEPAPDLPRGAPDAYDRPTVLVEADKLTATVSGSWTTRLDANHIDLRITYRNDGRNAAVLPGTGFAARRGDDRAEATQVNDITGVDLADARADNDEERQIVSVYDGPRTGTIRILPGETRTVEATASFTDGVVNLDVGQDVIVRVPVGGGGARAIRFSTSRGWPW